MSLADIKTGENLFEPTNDDLHNCGISKIAYHFIAGVLKHGAAITAVIAPTVNSYKRLVRQGSMSGSTWAPVFMCYGSNNRTNMIRIPSMGGRIVLTVNGNAIGARRIDGAIQDGNLYTFVEVDDEELGQLVLDIKKSLVHLQANK